MLAMLALLRQDPGGLVPLVNADEWLQTLHFVYSRTPTCSAAWVNRLTANDASNG